MPNRLSSRCASAPVSDCRVQSKVPSGMAVRKIARHRFQPSRRLEDYASARRILNTARAALRCETGARPFARLYSDFPPLHPSPAFRLPLRAARQTRGRRYPRPREAPRCASNRAWTHHRRSSAQPDHHLRLYGPHRVRDFRDPPIEPTESPPSAIPWSKQRQPWSHSTINSDARFE